MRRKKWKNRKRISDETGIPQKMFAEKIKLNKAEGEPNQKWHFLVSWLGMAWYQFNFGERKEFDPLGFICPELWLWVFEVSELFDTDTMEKLYDAAVKYRNGNKDDWVKLKKDCISVLKNDIEQQKADG